MILFNYPNNSHGMPVSEGKDETIKRLAYDHLGRCYLLLKQIPTHEYDEVDDEIIHLYSFQTGRYYPTLQNPPLEDDPEIGPPEEEPTDFPDEEEIEYDEDLREIEEEEGMDEIDPDIRREVRKLDEDMVHEKN
ncbi:hypothetical protein [Negadavirga shengliensis]|uniref:Uncharacterized protein n=1 Tax=Negadavirga shengliensis TaxID=1389218 RepID=A0ABV9T4M3_9BACT